MNRISRVARLESIRPKAGNAILTALRERADMPNASASECVLAILNRKHSQ